jgi:anti-sigma factor RsiW
MRGEQDAMSASNEELLHAYHDGELSRWARWRFERVLRRSPALQRELASLQSLRRGLVALDAEARAPQLWDAIAARLPARGAAAARTAPARERGRGVVWWLAPLGAAAATAALVVAVLYSGLFTRAPATSGGAVRWIDSEGRSVMVLDDDPDTTIIWVLDGALEGALRGGFSDVV